jgi:hypothetical protein
VSHDYTLRRDPQAAGFFLQSAFIGQEKAQKTYQSILGNLEGYRGGKGSAKQLRNVQKMTGAVRRAQKERRESGDPGLLWIITSYEGALSFFWRRRFVLLRLLSSATSLRTLWAADKIYLCGHLDFLGSYSLAD